MQMPVLKGARKCLVVREVFFPLFTNSDLHYCLSEEIRRFPR